MLNRISQTIEWTEVTRKHWILSLFWMIRLDFETFSIIEWITNCRFQIFHHLANRQIWNMIYQLLVAFNICPAKISFSWIFLLTMAGSKRLLSIRHRYCDMSLIKLFTPQILFSKVSSYLFQGISMLLWHMSKIGFPLKLYPLFDM